MGRAKLHHIPGYAWHLTHRCHDKAFLLKFARDKRRWLHWLFEAKKRYGLVILGYTITSNHIHLLVYDTGRDQVISRSILLTASRTAREYNIRKDRSGAFWEDHYHATAVETETHLREGLIYVELNMVRAGVVDHPKNWPFGTYSEIFGGRQRYRLVDTATLMRLLGIGSRELLKAAYDSWIREKLSRGTNEREPKWTESIAVGGERFVVEIKERLGVRAATSRIIPAYEGRTGTGPDREEGASYILRENDDPYGSILMGKKGLLSNSVKLGAFTIDL
ncbi:MAG: transposase [Candidatus Aminicenantes bacterium]|nr:transposase [Candidatus Aminicenantes bacterium]